MVYVILVIAIIILLMTSNKEAMFSHTTIGRVLHSASLIAAIVCVIILIVRLIKFIF